MVERKAAIAIGVVIVIAVVAVGAYMVLSDDGEEGTSIYHYTISDVHRDINGNVWLSCTFEEMVYPGMTLSVVCDGYQLYESTLKGTVGGYSPGIMLDSTYGMTLDHIQEGARILVDGYETVRVT